MWPSTVETLECLSSRKCINNRTTILIIGGVLLILLLTLLSFAMDFSGSQFDNDDPSFFEIGTIPWFAGYLFLGSLLLGFEREVYITILRLEYMNSHIGEKRPSDRRIQFDVHSCLSRTTRFPLGVSSFLFRPFACSAW